MIAIKFKNVLSHKLYDTSMSKRFILFSILLYEIFLLKVIFFKNKIIISNKSVKKLPKEIIIIWIFLVDKYFSFLEYISLISSSKLINRFDWISTIFQIIKLKIIRIMEINKLTKLLIKSIELYIKCFSLSIMISDIISELIDIIFKIAKNKKNALYISFHKPFF